MLQTDKVSLKSSGGSYDGDVEIWRDGNDLKFKDISAGAKSLSELLANVPSHSITSHTGLGTDFAPQYYNAGRLSTFLATAANASGIAITADGGGNTNLAAHVADATIHQKVPKFVLRVAKSGQQYSTIQAAIDAIPTSGVDQPSFDQPWKIEVGPGVYDETVTLTKSHVTIEGAGQGITILERSAAEVPLTISVSSTKLKFLSVQTSQPVDCLVVGTGSAIEGPEIEECRFNQASETDGVYAIKAALNAPGTVARRCVILCDRIPVKGPIHCYVCELAGGGAAVFNFDGVAAATVQNCTFRDIDTLMQVKDSSGIVVLDTWRQDGDASLLETLSGNTSSSLQITRTHTTENVTDGTVTVTPLQGAGFFGTGEFLLSWSRRDQTFTAGYGADGAVPSFSDAPPHSQDDFTFMRQMTMTHGSGGDVAGSVVAIHEKSTSLGGSVLSTLLDLGQIDTASGDFFQARDLTTLDVMAKLDRSGVFHGSGLNVTGTSAFTGSSSFSGLTSLTRSSSGTTDLNAGESTATANHAAGTMTNLDGFIFKAPVKGGAGTITNATAARFKAVSGVGTSKNLSALFEGAVEFQDAPYIAKNVAAHATLLTIENTNAAFRGEIAVKGAAGGGFSFWAAGTQRWAFTNNGNDLSYYSTAAPAGDVLLLNGGTNKAVSCYATGTGTVNLLHGGTSRIKADSTGIGFFNVAPVARQAVTALTNANGTSDGTIDDVGGAFSQTTLNNNFRDLSDKVNGIRTALVNLGLLS